MTDQTKSELLPCPFCGTDDALIHGHAFGHPGVECRQCGCIGPRGQDDSEDDAQDAWNLRPLLAPAAPQREAIARAIYSIYDGGTDPWGAATLRRAALGMEVIHSANQQRALDAADSVLSLTAAPQPARLVGDGWVYFNPDTGEEYAPNHPIESGECCDAVDIRASTPQEDHLWAALQREWQKRETPQPDHSVLIAEVIERCAVAAEQQDKAGREWVRDSLWENILKRAGAEVRKLKGTLTIAALERKETGR